MMWKGLGVLRSGGVWSVVEGTSSLVQGHQIRCASHLKKKRSSIDPEIAKRREERKRFNLERDIRELLTHTKNLKPIDEQGLDPRIIRRLDEYSREESGVPYEEAERRAVLAKKWTAYQGYLARAERYRLRKLVASQERALKELRIVSSELYEAAVAPDTGLLSRTVTGPSATPPCPAYASPDGDYSETTRSFDYALNLDRKAQKERWMERKKRDIQEFRAAAKKK